MKTKTWLAFLIMFVSGIVIGVIGSNVFHHHRMAKMLKGSPTMMQQHLARVLTDKLSLTPEQCPAVEAQLMVGIQQIEALRDKHMNEFERTIKQTLQDLKPILTPEQQQILNTIEPRDLRPRGMPPPPPPPPPAPAPQEHKE